MKPGPAGRQALRQIAAAARDVRERVAHYQDVLEGRVRHRADQRRRDDGDTRRKYPCAN